MTEKIPFTEDDFRLIMATLEVDIDRRDEKLKRERLLLIKIQELLNGEVDDE